MTIARKMLLESVAGHLALLEKANPKKAGSPVAVRTRQYLRANLSRNVAAPKRSAP
jgi:hypothetical protein